MHYSGSFSTRELTFHVLVLATQNTLHPKVGWLATGRTAYMLMHSIFNNNLIFSVNAKINEKKTTAGYTFLLEHITKWIADSMIHLHGMIWNSNAKRRHLKNTTSLFNWSGFCLHVNNSDVWGVFEGAYSHIPSAEFTLLIFLYLRWQTCLYACSARSYCSIQYSW